MDPIALPTVADHALRMHSGSLCMRVGAILKTQPLRPLHHAGRPAARGSTTLRTWKNEHR
jgi:hypothetical protein